jgi:hypothetical protein
MDFLNEIRLRQELRKATIASNFIDNDLEKGKKGEVGEVRMWQGKKVQKQGDGSWKEIVEGRQSKSQDESKKEAKHSPEKLADFARQASVESLERTIKEHGDENMRKVAHQELERRKKEEHTQEEKKSKESKDGDKKESDSKESKQPKSKWKLGDVDPKYPNYFVAEFNSKGQPVWKSKSKHKDHEHNPDKSKSSPGNESQEDAKRMLDATNKLSEEKGTNDQYRGKSGSVNIEQVKEDRKQEFNQLVTDYHNYLKEEVELLEKMGDLEWEKKDVDRHIEEENLRKRPISKYFRDKNKQLSQSMAEVQSRLNEVRSSQNVNETKLDKYKDVELDDSFLDEYDSPKEVADELAKLEETEAFRDYLYEMGYRKRDLTTEDLERDSKQFPNYHVMQKVYKLRQLLETEF